jgi:predicted peptidase
MKTLFYISILLLPLFMVAQRTDLYLKKHFVRNGDTLYYRMLLPEGYVKNKSYPVITFLHGSGERGGNNEAQLTHGGELFLNDSLKSIYKAIVIFPQCPKDSAWRYIKSKKDTTSPTGRVVDFTMAPKDPVPSQLVKKLLDSLIKSKAADPKRMYIGGLSLGGFGTFNMIERYPKFFAAAFPICGGGDITMAKRFAKHTSVWIFHGDEDKAVDVHYSRKYFSELKKLKADVKYNEYPGVGHNSWDNAFAEKDLVPWIFAKKKR